MKTQNTKLTTIACYNGCITQAAVCMLPSLLFVTFQQSFDISLAQLGMLTVINFSIQILVDFIGARIIEQVSPRLLMIVAHLCGVVGLSGLGIFPFILPPFAGVMLSISISAVGGGLLEVLVSPIIESLPGDAKAAAMSLLHSFYCWGCVAVVLLSTLYFAVHFPWQYLPLLWAVVPLVGVVLFSLAPLFPLAGEEGGSMLGLFAKPRFWLLMLLMLCAGASEQAMSQWASYFAQIGLSINKTIGDLAGPMAFSVLMGLSRLLGARQNIKISISHRLLFSAALCLASYLLTVCAPHPMLSLLGCAICGFAVGSMWPGTFSLAAEWFPKSGGMLFALLALGGDIGCATGPGLVGLLSDAAQKVSSYGALKFGLAAAAAFPLVMLVCLLFSRRKKPAT